MSEMNDPEFDSMYIFNSQIRHAPYKDQRYVTDNTLAFLNSTQAALQYSVGELIYLRAVWKRIDKRVEDHADKVGRT